MEKDQVEPGIENGVELARKRKWRQDVVVAAMGLNGI